jgi:PAS domain S-box-containing protein
LNALLAAIVDSSDDAVVAKTLEGVITSWNRGAETIFGYTAAEAVGRSITMIIPEDRLHEEDLVLARVRAGEKIAHFETVRRAKDGRLVDVSITVSPIRDRKGGIVGVSKVARDITERKKADIAFERLAAIVDSSDDAVVAKTLEGVIASWNRGAETIFGYTAAEAVGQSITLIIPEDRLHEEDQVLARIRAGLKIDHFETVRRAKDGRRVDVSITVSPIRDKKGTIVGASKVARDITERKRIDIERQRWLEREQRARQQAERAIQTRDEFLATVSHELRSPLNAIVGWAHVLQTGKLPADAVQQAAETISRNAAMQSQLISDILDMQRLSSGKLRLDVREVDLARVLEAAIETVRPAAAAKSLTLSTKIAPVGAVAGDPDRLQQIVWNLLSNAVKFTPSGGEVRLQLRKADGSVEISVEDDGPGIRPEFLPHMFESFRQDSRADHRSDGVGLGLSIARQLAELHGGSVAARNRADGSGAVLTVLLPRGPLDRVQAIQRPDVAVAPGALSLQGTRVLVVDDELDAREVVAALLTQLGADVTVAASAEEALTLLSKVRPNVIVSDISMPEQSGYDLLRSIRALPPAQGGSVPAIALTAATTTEDRLRVTRAGYEYYLPKPVQPLELATAIAALAGIRPAD